MGLIFSNSANTVTQLDKATQMIVDKANSDIYIATHHYDFSKYRNVAGFRKNVDKFILEHILREKMSVNVPRAFYPTGTNRDELILSTRENINLWFKNGSAQITSAKQNLSALRIALGTLRQLNVKPNDREASGYIGLIQDWIQCFAELDYVMWCFDNNYLPSYLLATVQVAIDKPMIRLQTNEKKLFLITVAFYKGNTIEMTSAKFFQDLPIMVKNERVKE